MGKAGTVHPERIFPLPRLLFALGWLAVTVGLVLPTVLPEAANVTILALMVAGLLTILFDPASRFALRQPAPLLMLGAGGLLLLALLPTARSADHILAILILAPIWFCAALVALIAPLGDRLTLTVIGLLSLLGTAGAAAVAGYDVHVLGQTRGGFTVNNPIHLADLAVTLGFAALIGLYGTARWRWLFLLGPILALATILWSGSRGPLLAFVLLVLVAAPLLLFTLWKRGRWVPLLTAAVAIAALVASPFVELQVGSRTFSVARIVQDVTGAGAADNSTLERTFMLQSAWGAFLASPIYGHGLVDYTAKAAQFSPPGNPFAPSGHLHNDIADFAVIGGTLGLVSYAIILLAPLVGAFRAPRHRRPPLLFLATTLSVGYFAMGLTNAMIGILTQTVLYAVLVAILTHFARHPTETGAP